jgi:hypothetical protein
MRASPPGSEALHQFGVTICNDAMLKSGGSHRNALDHLITPRYALPTAVEFHPPTAYRKVHGALVQLDERGGARVRFQLSVLGCGLVHMRCDDGRRPDELVHRMRRRKRGHRVRAEIEQGEIRLVEIAYDRFHLGAREIRTLDS